MTIEHFSPSLGFLASAPGTMLAQTPVAQEPVAPSWLWILFGAIVVIVMTIDLGIVHRSAHAVSTREAGAWVTVWVTLAVLFSLPVWLVLGSASGSEFAAGYFVELALSVDNLFVFIIIFRYFHVKPEHQHRVLFWGIVGAMAMRAIFIFCGVELLKRWTWLFIPFGAVLIFSGLRLPFKTEGGGDLQRNILVRLVRRILPVTDEYAGAKFFVREAAVLKATPLFVVLVLVEGTDVVFAVDSVPAILGITTSFFIAFTSNIFAVLGLRSMYFLLAGAMDRFHYLNIGLCIVLVFIGTKMVLHGYWHVSAVASLVVVLAVLGTSLVLSIVMPPQRRLPAEAERRTASGEHHPADENQQKKRQKDQQEPGGDDSESAASPAEASTEKSGDRETR